jgi:hypothetical protein
MSGAIRHGIFLFEALVFVAEGLAEFLPIPSAGHLIVASERKIGGNPSGLTSRRHWEGICIPSRKLRREHPALAAAWDASREQGRRARLERQGVPQKPLFPGGRPQAGSMH